MEKVIIISYFYPPCNLTASQRTAAWAKYLNGFGYYPIVITRNWENHINVPADISKTAGNDKITEESELNTVIYLPYKGTLKDKLYARFGDKRLVGIRKMLSLYELVMQNFFIDALPINNIYYEAERILKSDKSIQKVIISANPFSSFFIGYKLKKKFPYIKWVADYRDDWNTSELKHSDNILNRFISLLESISEKKWVGSASYITTISGYYLSKILGFVSNKGAVILNGFFEEDLNNVMPVEKAGTWVITYNGTLYPTQNIEMFLDAFKILADRYKGVIELKINFPGLAYNRQQADRVMNAMHGYQHLLNITERVPRQKVFELQNASHAFLMVSHTGVKGIPSSKLYEYLCFAKPVILCPNDQDIIEETLNDTGLGIICSNTNDIVVKLSELIDVYIATGKISIKANNDRIYRYSRRSQTKALADVLDQL